ncbi:thiopeptide-type bacteriocin biosynthesis protein [Lysinibacillus xylanilyticus]|uniref:thiopeptide-type bacteriocin biosynthesis protein n=1 Tax=Lysinibacillus xylanilyticus TaxID=582475 RepID=UPI003821D94E
MEDDYFIRVPYFTESFWRSFVEKEECTYPSFSSIEKDYFHSSLILSSLEFYQALIQYEKKKTKKRKSVEKTLSNYLYRMTYKQSPFGFFSTVIGVTKFNDSLNGVLNNINDLRKQNSKISISKEWYFNLVKNVQTDDKVIRNLKVKRGDYILKNQKKYVTRIDYDLLSDYELIVFNKLVEEILDICTEFTDMNTLIFKIGEKNKLSEKQVMTIVKKLLEQDILISDIHPYETKDNLEMIINKLKGTKYQEKLLSIVADIKYLNKEKEFTPISLISLINKCEEICESSQYIVGNSIIKNNDSSVIDNKKLFSNLQEILPYLLITFNKEAEELKIFTEKFYDQYGNNYVAFLRVINECGTFNYDESDNLKSSNFLINKIIEALAERKKINLNLDDFPIIDELKLPFLKQIPNLQVFINLCSIDDETYVNMDNGIKMRNKGSFEGRLLSDINNPKANTNDEFIVDIPYSSVDLKMNNILGDSINDIDLNDIYVFWEENKLKLFSKKLNKVIIVRKNNMVNFVYIPSFLRMLYTISNQLTWTGLYEDKLDYLQYIPRITYKNIILKLETWRIIEEGLNYNNFVNKLNFLSEKFSMPKNIIIFSGDDKYPLDLSNSYDVNKSFELYSKHGYLELKEDIRKTYAGYSIDFVMNFNNALFKMKKANLSPRDNNIFLSNEASMTLGALNDRWLYFEVFIDRLEQDYILEEICRISIGNKFFFVRYFNNDDETLRIRFKTNNLMECTNVMSILCNFFNKEIKNKTIKKYNLNSYERENLYFGGEENLVELENYFILESEFVINNILTITNSDEKRILIILYITHFVKILNFEMEPIIIRQSSKELYRVMKRQLIEVYRSPLDIDIESNVSSIIQNAKVNTLDLSDLLKKKLIHLFINRAIGYAPDEEKLIIDTVKQFIITLNYLVEK